MMYRRRCLTRDWEHSVPHLALIPAPMDDGRYVWRGPRRLDHGVPEEFCRVVGVVRVEGARVCTDGSKLIAKI